MDRSSRKMLVIRSAETSDGIHTLPKRSILLFDFTAKSTPPSIAKSLCLKDLRQIGNIRRTFRHELCNSYLLPKAD
ncbi:MAG: hypothetical protein Fues2KO_39910 [Fuerstiella sp.]